MLSTDFLMTVAVFNPSRSHSRKINLFFPLKNIDTQIKRSFKCLIKNALLAIQCPAYVMV